MPVSAKLLFAEDLSELHGISRRQARRWLARLESSYGTLAVGRTAGRRGPRLYTTEAALARIGPHADPNASPQSARLDDLERQLAALKARLDGLEEEKCDTRYDFSANLVLIGPHRDIGGP